MNIEKLPTSVLLLGLAAIVFIAVLMFILIDRLIKKGLAVGVGKNKFVLGAVNKEVDGKLELFKADIEKKEKDRLHDEEVRKKLLTRKQRQTKGG